MDNSNYSTEEAERKRGSHLTYENRVTIQCLLKEGRSQRYIARELNCSPTTISNEIRRGTPPRKNKRGRKPIYKARYAQKVYLQNRKRCCRQKKLLRCKEFIKWMIKQVREHRWSLDACVGYARQNKLFPYGQIPCTKTLYNALWHNDLPITLFECPNVLKHKKKKLRYRKNKRLKGRSIEERPADISACKKPGHWEIDTVIGKKRGREAVVLTLIEKHTRNYLAIRISGKNSLAVMEGMNQLRTEFGDHFNEVFKTITADNGSEFELLAQLEQWGTKVYFAHPYSSWERPQNERHNGLLRAYLPKGTSIESFSAERILMFADEINALPRRTLGYRTPEELFEQFLDDVYGDSTPAMACQG